MIDQITAFYWEKYRLSVDDWIERERERKRERERERNGNKHKSIPRKISKTKVSHDYTIVIKCP